LLKQLSPNSLGWDGTYNGQTMPNSDYWFTLSLENEKHITGHFSLKR
jgi:gliding motility-associated-like protein